MSSALRISPSFLNRLKALFPQSIPPNTSAGWETQVSSVLRSPWYIVTAVAFSASNKPEAVSQVFQYVLKELKETRGASQIDEKFLAQRFREGIFKSGLISGYAKAINSLKALNDSMPEELRDIEVKRNTALSLEEYNIRGDKLFKLLYGETAESVDALLYSAYPDMGWFSKTIGYGLVYGDSSAISVVETSYTLVAALIATDTPQQTSWHLDSARRGGATFEEVVAVRQLSIEAAKYAGVQWQNVIPEVTPSS